MTENITFRSQLIESVTDFAEACRMGHMLRPAILVELIVTISKYHEEGLKLFPEVYLCDNVSDMLKLIPDHSILPIGKTAIAEDAIREILKKCAPLAIGGWCIYIEGDDGYLRFGLFRGPQSPLSIPNDETLLSTSATVKVVRVFQISNDCVEIKSYVGGLHRIDFSHRRDTLPSPLQYLGNLVDAICAKSPPDIKESLATFLKKSLKDALLLSHGSIVAVCRTAKIPKILSDGIHLSNPINFAQQVADILQGQMSPSSLVSEISLLTGMLNSDGIVVFSNNGKLLAYNCFISLPPRKSKSPLGGARKRAFDALCDKLGKGLYAVFIQSQDGWTDFRKEKND